MPSRAVVWFRRDLRTADHPALLAALAAADQVVPVFVVDRTLLHGRTSGPNRRALLHGALQALARDLEALGGRLLLREGDRVTVIPALARQAAADAVHCSREYTFEDDPDGLAAWREGRTGYPLVGTGIDAAPFYRIFNPVTQAERFDPAGRRLHPPLGPRAGQAGATRHLRPPAGQPRRPGGGRRPPRHRLPPPHHRPHHRPQPRPRPLPGRQFPPFVTTRVTGSPARDRHLASGPPSGHSGLLR